MSGNKENFIKRVLVCGQDEQLALRVARLLPACEVARAFGADEVVASVRSGPLELILMDRQGPACEAISVLRRVRDVEAATETDANGPSHARMIILTELSERTEVIAALREGVFCYFSRPYLETAFDEIVRHAGSGAPWHDSIRVDSATPAWLRLIARCEIATADRVIQFMNDLSDLSGKDRDSMGFALKEILLNAMEYGGRFDRDRLVEISYVRGKLMVLYRIRDPGDGFSLEELNHAAIANPPGEPIRHLEIRDSQGIRPGGFGVLISRKLVDDLIYNEQGNDVLLIKYLHESMDS